MITLILKSTDGCNLRCKYCSIGKKNINFNKIDFNTLIKSGDFIVKFAREKNENEINIILHGGEPTLIKSDDYRNFFEYLKSTYNNIKWHFSIQTNGYFISDDFIKLFKEFNINVGVSIDGNENTNNATRIDIFGKGTFERIKENIIKLKENNICVSALIVVTKLLLTEDLTYLNFFNYYDINLKINPLLNYGEASNLNDIWLDNGEYSNYLIKVYKYILDNDLEIEINPIANIFNSILINSPITDCSYKNECGKKFVCIDFKGDIYPCGRFYDVDGSCMGNIFKNKAIKQYESVELDSDCNDCKYKEKCYGGCSAYRKIMKTNKTPLCYDIKTLYDYFSNDGILEYINYLKNKKEYLENILQLEENKDV